MEGKNKEVSRLNLHNFDATSEDPSKFFLALSQMHIASPRKVKNEKLDLARLIALLRRAC